MPVLGAVDDGPIHKPGVSIPVGSLDRWRAARDNSANELVEVPFFGDSTTQANYDGAYSWVAVLREISRAVYPDGGRGIAGTGDTAFASNEDLCIVQSRSGWGPEQGGGYDFMGGNSFASEDAGDSIVFQGYGTQARLHYSLNSLTGDFTYAVDGGSPVTVHAFSLYAAVEVKPVLIPLGAYGLHTITVVNLGGVVVTPPTMVGAASTGSGGTLTTGTYRYVATSVTAAGETIASDVVSASVVEGFSGTSSIGLTIVRTPGAVTYNVYRALGASGGTFDLIKSGIASASSYGTVSLYTDTGADTPNTSVHPPVSGTAGRAGPAQAVVIPEFMKATGIVYHNQGISGSGAGNHFNISASDAHNNGWWAPVSIGLDPGSPPHYVEGGVQWSNPEAPNPQYRNPPLAVWCLGGNDVAGSFELLDANIVHVTDCLGEFIRCCRATNTDPLVLVEHFEWFGNREHSNRVRQAIWSTATAMGAAVADVHQALGPWNVGQALYGQGAHITQPGLDAWANWLWDEVLSL